jgi:hypothetical protein
MSSIPSRGLAGTNTSHSMSQHYISTKLFEILVGWDRPLQYFFEIREAQFHRIAERHGVVLESEQAPTIPAELRSVGTRSREYPERRPRTESPTS